MQSYVNVISVYKLHCTISRCPSRGQELEVEEAIPMQVRGALAMHRHEVVEVIAPT
jgi:hypothetical protein